MKVKKLRLTKFSIVGLLFIVACGANENESENSSYPPIGGGESVVSSYPTISDFFPFEANTTFVTRTVPDSMFELEEQMFTAFVSENRFQQRVSSMGIDTTAILQYSDGVLRQVFSEVNLYMYEDVTNVEPNTEFVVLAEPLAPGTIWQTADGITSQITAVNKEITTPFATFTETLEVTTDFPDGSYSVSVFAKGHGRVWDSYTISFEDTTTSITTHLVDVIHGPMQTELVIFEGEDPIEIIDIYINTNQNFEEIFSEIIGVSINKIEVIRNGEDTTVYVDFAAEPYSMVNVSNIFTNFYRVLTFVPTINGAPYAE
ncbi:MAG: hypothetical protein FWE02_07740 [Defluviitaleaceae bacterium]|nr:hypothetical protein [Defluviitaleaceae bacterium]